MAPRVEREISTDYWRRNMDRRKMLASAGAVAVAGAVSSVASAQETKVRKHASTLASMHQKCLEACQNCESTCNETVNHCMTHLAKGTKEHAACAAIAMSCQEFCSLSAQIIARSCSLASAACTACAKACDACAAECEKIKTDQQMLACAKACRDCATSCRSMA
jgi:hypothetical protein